MLCNVLFSWMHILKSNVLLLVVGFVGDYSGLVSLVNSLQSPIINKNAYNLLYTPYRFAPSYE